MPRFESKPYREFVRTQTCTWRILGYMDCDGPMDPQHDPPLSSQISDDLDCIPMCRKHHTLHKDRPKFYRSVITEQVLRVTKQSIVRGFFRHLGLQTEKRKQSVKSKKSTATVKTSKFQIPLQPNSKRRENSKLAHLTK